MDIRVYIESRLMAGIGVIVSTSNGLFEVVDIDNYTVTVMDCGAEDTLYLNKIERVMSVDEVMDVKLVVEQQKPKYV